MGKGLPIFSIKDSLLEALDKHDTIIILGETGSGKTTQVPQFIYDWAVRKGEGMMKMAVTQPRRVAAMSLAKRVSQEMNVELGKLVGYSVRFEDLYCHETCIKFVTDGMLLREFLGDRQLNKYSVIIIDEAHERTLRTDILFGMFKKLQNTRKKPLKIVIMSATLDPQKFLNFFSNSLVFRVPGRQYPVKLFYTAEPQQDYLDATILTIFQLHAEKPAGDILVFLTGQEEIDFVQKILQEYGPQCTSAKDLKMLICPIYASLPAHQQMLVFKETTGGYRKVILATNIAETSITIPGIRYVIDPGFAKMRLYNSRTGMESLVVRPVSKSSCRQRTGRAGREAPGEAYRLFPEDSFKSLDDETPPEILRTNLANVILLMKASGIEDVLDFEYLDPPDINSLKRGLEELLALGALNILGDLSSLGRQMAECPLSPQLSRVLIESKQLKCTEEILTILAMLAADSIFRSPSSATTMEEEKDSGLMAKKAFRHPSGDHMTLLNIYNAYVSNNASVKWCREHKVDTRSMKHVSEVRKQLVQYCEQHKIEMTSCQSSPNLILKCLTAGHFLQCALRQPDGSFRSLMGRQNVSIHPGSVLFGSKPDCVIYHELVITSKCYIRSVSSCQANWIAEYTKQSNLNRNSK